MKSHPTVWWSQERAAQMSPRPPRPCPCPHRGWSGPACWWGARGSRSGPWPGPSCTAGTPRCPPPPVTDSTRHGGLKVPCTSHLSPSPSGESPQTAGQRVIPCWLLFLEDPN